MLTGTLGGRAVTGTLKGRRDADSEGAIGRRYPWPDRGGWAGGIAGGLAEAGLPVSWGVDEGRLARQRPRACDIQDERTRVHVRTGVWATLW